MAAGEEVGADHWRVLLVDDEESIRESLSVYLRSAGFRVDTAGDALAARELLKQNRYGLVLSDISMPEISGLDLLQEIKQQDREIEVIMITAYLDISLAIQAMRFGAYDFFTKPFNYDKIILTIERVQEKRRLQAQARRYEALKSQRAFEERAVLETTLGLARAVEQRDKYNLGHGKRTAGYAEMLGLGLHFTEERLRALRYGGLLHDIGKIGIDDRILNKPGRLTDDEYAAIKRHPEIGEYILTPISFLTGLSAMVKHHHERWDGNGYPSGLSGEDIPLEARILTLADFFDSVTSARPYRRPMTVKQALALIWELKGQHFDPILTDIFMERISKAGESAHS